MNNLKNPLESNTYLILFVLLIFVCLLFLFFPSKVNEDDFTSHVSMVITANFPKLDPPKQIWVNEIYNIEVCKSMTEIFEGYYENGNYVSVDCISINTGEIVPGTTKDVVAPCLVSEYELNNIYVNANIDTNACNDIE